MWELIEASVEYRKWGMNAATVGMMGTVLFTVVEGWALWGQNLTVWREKSGESLSVTWFMFFFIAFSAFCVYGWHINSLASVFNGFVLAVLHLPLLWGLWEFKGFSTIEKIQCGLFALTVPAMVILPWKEEIFMIVSVGTVYSVAYQPYELWVTKRPGVVEARLLVVYLLSTVFWVVYAFAIDAWVLEILTGLNLVFLSLSTVFWVKFKFFPKSE